jgi:hypothetical protein
MSEDEHLKEVKAKEEFQYKSQMKRKKIPTTLKESWINERC